MIYIFINNKRLNFYKMHKNKILNNCCGDNKSDRTFKSEKINDFKYVNLRLYLLKY